MSKDEQQGGATTQNAAAAPAAPSSRVGIPAWVVGGVAVLLLGAYTVFIYVMLGKVGDQHWDRILVLFQGVEALAFAAAGALFGVQVQRGQVQRAETQLNEQKRAGEKSKRLVSETRKVIEANRITSVAERLGPEGADKNTAATAQAAVERTELAILRNLETSINAIL